MSRKLYSSTVLSILLFFVFSGHNESVWDVVNFKRIDASRDPLQIPCAFEDPIKVRIDGGFFTILPLARYELSGLVVVKETYSNDWDGKISPFDLAIVWGKLTEPECQRYISYSQRNRWYFYKCKQENPFDASYIISHSSNNHIIPGNENIRHAIKALKEKDRVLLEGFLVDLKGTYKGRDVTWNTSLSRTDTGQGACELFYVSKVKIYSRGLL
jgi:hypothetical protein